MRPTALPLVLLSLSARSLRPGGCKAIIAENLALRHQLTVQSRSRSKGPARAALGCLCLYISPRRPCRVAIVIRPARVFNFQRARVQRKYRRLCSYCGRTRPGPTGPCEAFITAIAALKQRNRRFGRPRIAYLVKVKFGMDCNKSAARRVLARLFYRNPGHAHGPSWLTGPALQKQPLAHRAVCLCIRDS